MSVKRGSGANVLAEADDAPELDDAFFDKAEVRRADQVVRRGRPPLENPKVQVTLRLDPDVIEHFRGSGPKWQSLLNDTLRSAAGLSHDAVAPVGPTVTNEPSGRFTMDDVRGAFVPRLKGDPKKR